MKQFSEAIKLKDGIFYNLEYHQERMNRTCVDFGIKQINLFDVTKSVPKQFQEGLFKFRVLYSHEILSLEFISYSFRSVKTVGIIIDNEIDYRYKYQNRETLNKLLQESGCDDIIIIRNGFVTDGSSSSLVFESAEGLFTPTNYLLPGTKRQYLLDKDIITEKEITINDIKSFDKVYFINAMVDIEDNISIETSSLLWL